MNKSHLLFLAAFVVMTSAQAVLLHRIKALNVSVQNLITSTTASKPQALPPDEMSDDSNDEPPLQLRHASDIEAHFSQSLKEKNIKAFAQALMEADEWFFEPSEIEQADTALSEKTEALRVWAKSAVERVLSLAIAAPNGETAALYLREANSVLGLYPQPDNDDRQKELEAIVYKISDATRRVDEIRRMRYNQWAIERIEDGVRQFHENKKVGPDAVVLVCVNALKYVDPAHLDPTVMDLYQYLVQISREKAGDSYFSQIAKGLNNPDVGRRTPLDFDK